MLGVFTGMLTRNVALSSDSRMSMPRGSSAESTKRRSPLVTPRNMTSVGRGSVHGASPRRGKRRRRSLPRVECHGQVVRAVMRALLVMDRVAFHPVAIDERGDKRAGVDRLHSWVAEKPRIARNLDQHLLKRLRKPERAVLFAAFPSRSAAPDRGRAFRPRPRARQTRSAPRPIAKTKMTSHAASFRSLRMEIASRLWRGWCR